MYCGAPIHKYVVKLDFHNLKYINQCTIYVSLKCAVFNPHGLWGGGQSDPPLRFLEVFSKLILPETFPKGKTIKIVEGAVKLSWRRLLKNGPKIKQFMFTLYYIITI